MLLVAVRRETRVPLISGVISLFLGRVLGLSTEPFVDQSCSCAGKLFPGPHLYAGAAVVVLWAVAASMVPLMQKGNDTARLAHISANVLNIALFAWQVGPNHRLTSLIMKVL